MLLPFGRFGYLAIPLAYTLYLNLGILVATLVIRYKLGNEGGRSLIRSMVMHSCSALISLAALSIVARFVPNQAVMGLMILLGGGLYFLLARFVFSTEEAIHCGAQLAGVWNSRWESGSRVSQIKKLCLLPSSSSEYS